MAVSIGPSDLYTPFFYFTRGLAEYRQGRFAPAVEWLRKALVGNVNSGDNARYLMADMVLAMALYRLNQIDEARTTFARGVEIEQTKLPSPDSGDLGEAWRDCLTGRILMAEARALIEGAPTPGK